MDEFGRFGGLMAFGLVGICIYDRGWTRVYVSVSSRSIAHYAGV